MVLHTPYDDGDYHCLYGCSATLWAAPSGTGPFTYSWLPVAATDSVIYNACTNTYTVTMTDDNGCTATDTVTISQPDSISITATTTAIHYDCDSLQSGCVYVISVDGGVPGYDYLWSSGATTQDLCTSVAGQYCFHVVDSKGCSMKDTCFNITASPTRPLTLQLTGQNPSCLACTDGSVTAHVSGGAGPYTYVWTPNVSGDTVAAGLGTGTYVFCVTDGNGCEKCDSSVLIYPLMVSESAQGTLRISPNPAREVLTIQLPVSSDGSVNAVLYTILGEVVSCPVKITAGGKEISLAVSALAPGAYYVQVVLGNQCILQRFLKE